MASLGNGMFADSIAIIKTTPRYPQARTPFLIISKIGSIKWCSTGITYITIDANEGNFTAVVVS